MNIHYNIPHFVTRRISLVTPVMILMHGEASSAHARCAMRGTPDRKLKLYLTVRNARYYVRQQAVNRRDCAVMCVSKAS